MKTNANTTILKGDSEEAIYKDQEINDYINNPFIEALPKIFSEDDVIENFSVIPSIKPTDKGKERHIRYHIIKRTKNFIQPLPVHFTVERRLSTLIRRGYLARNPLDKSFLKRIRVINQLKDKEDIGWNVLNEDTSQIRSTADSMAIIGISGIGKTTAIERLLLMYPQIIKHRRYKNKNFTRTQIVWLKIDCPYDGNLSTLCKSFFKAIDDILGTRYLEKFGYANRVTSSMLLNMTTLASLYGIGVLVIDEIQNLLNNSNMDEMLDFFVTLSNMVGIPTVLIGTSKAQQIFSGNFRQARRAGSDGMIMWDRMEKDSEEWNFFLESLWDFNCLKEKTDLTEQVRNIFYDECQGITAIAVNLFILAQERALSEEKEKLTTKIIKDTSKKDLHMIQPMIKALRCNNIRDIAKYEDISIKLGDVENSYKKDIDLIGKLKDDFKDRQKSLDAKRRSTIESLTIELEAIGIFTNLSSIDIKKECEKVVDKEQVNADYNELKSLALKSLLDLNEKKKNKVDTYVEQDENAEDKKLINLYDAARKATKHPYEKFKEKGYIKNAVEEFLKVN